MTAGSSQGAKFQYQAVKTWSRAVLRQVKEPVATIFDLQLLLIPINVNQNHWVALAVDFERRHLTIYDSLQPSTATRMIPSMVYRYLSNEAQKCNTPFDSRTWTDTIDTSLQQPNQADCGLYMCARFLSISFGCPIPTASKLSRQNLAVCIIQKRIYKLWDNSIDNVTNAVEHSEQPGGVDPSLQVLIKEMNGRVEPPCLPVSPANSSTFTPKSSELDYLLIPSQLSSAAHNKVLSDHCAADPNPCPSSEQQNPVTLEKYRSDQVEGHTSKSEDPKILRFRNKPLNQKQTKIWFPYLNKPFDTNIPQKPLTNSSPPEQSLPLVQTLIPKSNKGTQDTRIGPDPNSSKRDNTLRIYLLNPNGISLANGNLQWSSTVQALGKEKKCDILCLPETNLNWKHRNLTSSFRKVVNKCCFTGSLSSSSSDIPFAESYQPGGTLTTICGPLQSRVVSAISDKSGLGQWSGFIFEGKPKRLLVITAYRPCKTTGPTTAYSQQVAILRSKGIQNPDPLAAFDDAIHQLLQQYSSTHEVVLAMDANSSLPPRSALRKTLIAFNMVDLIGRSYALTNDPPTHIKGSARIDFVFGTSAVTDSLTTSGIEPFHSDVITDHRGQFVDLDLQVLLQERLPKFDDPSPRYLSSRNILGVRKYQDELCKGFVSYDLVKRVEKLKQDIASHGEVTDSIAKRLNQVDKDLTAIMQKAENTCSLHDQRLPWSPKLHQAFLVCKYWRLKCSDMRGSYVSTATLQTLLSQITANIPVPRDLREACKFQRQAARALRSIKHQAYHLRISFLETLMKDAQAQQNAKIAGAVKSILHTEGRRRSFCTVRKYMNPSQRSQISRILVPDPEDPNSQFPKQCKLWRNVTDPIEIERLLIDRNQQHFQQAHGTPFTVGPLEKDLGFTSDTTSAQAILDGNYDSSPLSTELQDFLKHLKTPQEVLSSKEMDVHITPEDLCHGYKRWREGTTTSPISKRHLGHYQSLLPFNMHEDIHHRAQLAASKAPNLQGHKDLPLSAISSVFYQLQADLLNIATAHGFAFDRWCSIVTLLIEKDVGRPKIHRLRVLHLYEPDYNLLLKMIYAKRLMSHCESLSLLHPDQWGGRKDRSAADQALLKELTFTNSHLTKRNLAVMDLDAAACYDRIVPNLALLSCRRFGLPAAVALLLGTVLLNAQYCLKTQLGLSSQTYSHSDLTPVYGPGQGSGASPPIWLLISVVLMNALSSTAQGAIMTTPNQRITVHRRMDGFVDDAAIWCSVTSLLALDLLTRLQSDVQQWERLLYISGGALELSKCCFYLLLWQFDDKGIPYLQANDFKLSLSDSNTNTSAEITPKQPGDAHKTLGQWKAANLDQSEALNQFCDKCALFAEALNNSPLTTNEVRMSFDSILLPRLRYLLSTTFLSSDDLYKAMQPILSAVLSRSGINRNSPHEIVFCPQEYGGFGLKHPYFEQGLLMLSAILRHVNSQSDLGKLMLVNLGWLQIHAGIQTPVWETNHKLPYLPSCWLTGVQEFLQSITGRVHIHPSLLWIPPLLREHDQSIMPLFTSLYTTKELQRLNRVRLYLQVYNLSDVVTPGGSQFLPGVLSHWITSTNYPTLHQYTRSCYEWPRQGKPPVADFKLWARALKKTLGIQTSGVLSMPLGAWTQPPSVIDCSRRWLSYIDLYELRYEFRSDWKSSVISYDIHTFHRRTCTGDVTLNPSRGMELYPCDQPLSLEGTSILLPVRATQFSPIAELPADDLSLSWKQWLDDPIVPNCPWDNAAMQLQFTPCQYAQLKECATIGSPLILCSDGGVKESRGTFGWVCALGRDVELASGIGVVYGSPRFMHSFRAEAMGAYYSFLFLTRVCQVHPALASTPLEWHCDNQSLVRTLRTSQRAGFKIRPCHGVESDFDILIPLRVLMKQFHKLSIHHVKAHQDQVKKPSDLTIAERWNVFADRLASSAYTMPTPSHSSLPPPSFSLPCILSIQSLPVTSSLPVEVRRAAATPAANDYYKRKHGWAQATVDVIDWLAQSRSIHRFQHSDRIRLQKFRIRWLPVGQRCFMMGQQTKECPFCCAHETVDHLLQCPHPSRRKARERMYIRLEQYLKSLHTEPGLGKLLLASLTHWTERSQHFQPLVYDGPLSNHPWCQHLLDTQSAIGWHNLWAGYFTQTWGDIMEIYYQQEKIKSDGTRWTSSLIQFLWQFVLEMWSSRNDRLHSTTTAHLDRKQTREIHAEVRRLYDDCLQLYGHYPSLFSEPCSEMLTKSNYHLRYWCENARRDLLQRCEENKKRQGQDIRSFFDDPRYYHSRAEALLEEIHRRFGLNIPPSIQRGIPRLKAREKDLGYWCDNIKMILHTTTFETSPSPSSSSPSHDTLQLPPSSPSSPL